MASKKNYLPWEDLKAFIQKQELAGRADYQKWHDEHKPAYAPKYPNRVFKSEWVSWNDYLGTKNQFGNPAAIDRSIYRPYWEAVRYVQALGLNSAPAYYEWARTEARPFDIPPRPDAVYADRWTSWIDYLGKSAVATVEAAREQVARGIFAIATEDGLPGNIYTLVVAKRGLPQMKDKWDPLHKMVKIYKMDDNFNKFLELWKLYGKPYLGNPEMMMVGNPGQFFYECDLLLERPEVG